MSRQTSITWDVEYHIDRYRIGQRVEVRPVIETINGRPEDDFPPSVINMVLETLYNDDAEFGEEISRRKIA